MSSPVLSEIADGIATLALNRPEKLNAINHAMADRVAADYHPLGRVADAEEVAAAVLFLLSDNARFVTGVDLPVDGGHAISGPDQGRPTQYRLSE